MTESDCVHVCVIMAGGAGERFWPVSRRARPKQLLPLNDPDKSMLLEAVERAAAVTGLENTYIITGRHLTAPICDAGLPIPCENILSEPCKRNTTGALAYVTAHLLARRTETPPERISMAVLTADHWIGNMDAFLTTVRAAMRVADTVPALVTCGITPTYPATGYGYIETEPETRQEMGAPVFKARAFHEKPDAQRAREFLAAKRFLWNSGMFFWRVSTFLEELSAACPETLDAIHAMATAFRDNDTATVERCFAAIEDISIDYALMEHTRNIMVVEGLFSWGDIGSWPALRRNETVDDNGNFTRGDPIVIDCENSVVVNATGAEKMDVGVLGLSDVTVVVTEDAVLVMDSARSEETRRIVAELKARGARRL